MRKKILVALFFNLLGASIVLLIISWNLLKESRYKLEEKYLDATIEQIIDIIEQNEINKKNAIELYLDNYLKSLQFIEYLLIKHEENLIGEDIWKEIARITQVSEVFLVDKNGIIINSSDGKTIGRNYYKEDNLKSFIPLIEGKVKEGYLLLPNVSSLKDNKKKTYLGIYREGGGMLQIETNSTIIDDYLETTSLDNIIGNIPTRREEILFVLDKNTKKLIGLSKNNRKIEDEVKLFKDAVYSLNEAKFVVAKGKVNFVLAKEKDNKIIGIAVEEDSVLADAKENFFKGIAVISILCFIVFIYLYHILDKLILKDLDIIIKKLNSFCNGDRSISFGTGKTKEISKLKIQLNDVIEAFESRPSRIDNMISILGPKYGVYEYYYSLKQLYTSKNLGELLGKDEKTYRDEVIKYVEQFSDKVKSSNEPQEFSDEYVTKDGRVIDIRRTIYNNIIYAVLEDITERANQRILLEKSLLEEKEKSYTDSLTGLYNRKKLDEIVVDFQGIIVLIDLDNFKKVNDERGHIEGDYVLKIIGKLLRESFDKDSIKLRLGGDEFVVLFNKTLLKEELENEIKNFIKKVREELKEYYIKQKLSVSIGAAYMTESYSNFETAYNCADKAMYMAKKNGKDSYYIFNNNE